MKAFCAVSRVSVMFEGSCDKSAFAPQSPFIRQATANNMPGRFIVFEGIDGSGKSTTIQSVAKILENAGQRTVQLREPTEKTDASREIRRILRTVKTIDKKISDDLLELFFIDRLWDIQHQIKPAIASGAIVLLDRYFISTAAYQAANAQETEKIVKSYVNDPRILTPDLLVYLNPPVQLAVSRIAARAERDVFETEARLTEISARYAIAVKKMREEISSCDVAEFFTQLEHADFESLARKITGATRGSDI
jgi:dTMP kinase